MSKRFRNQKTGTCHICGFEGKLSLEHVPPRKAFNENKAFMHFGDEVFGSGNFPWDLTGSTGEQHQNGIGWHTLCGRCNSNTGSWYGSSFVDFIHKAYKETHKYDLEADEKIELSLHNIKPLRVIKQIVTMFFSINNPKFAKVQTDLKKLVLNKNKKGIKPERYAIYTYLLTGSIARYIGVSASFNLKDKKTRLISELSAPPFGFVLEINPDGKGDKKYENINRFANKFKIDDEADMKIEVPVYESNSAFPGDVRTREEIMNDYLVNKLKDERN